MNDQQEGKPITRSERVREASRSRREQQKQELREAIIDAAAALFLEKGYEQFSLRQVAEQIGYSATTIYLYFADKDDLLFTVVDRAFERFNERLSTVAASIADPLQRLIALGQAYVRFGLDNPVHYQLMFIQRSDFLMQKRIGESKPRLSAMQVVIQAAQDAMDAGQVRAGDPVATFDALWSLMHGLVSLAITMPMMTPERVERAAEAAMTMAIKGIITPPRLE